MCLIVVELINNVVCYELLSRHVSTGIFSFSSIHSPSYVARHVASSTTGKGSDSLCRVARCPATLLSISLSSFPSVLSIRQAERSLIFWALNILETRPGALIPVRYLFFVTFLYGTEVRKSKDISSAPITTPVSNFKTAWWW